ncbi:hypothetical protein B0H67DRAFT_558341 [Lasiosphaeris hirsuta]|uniref:Nephrocystin 3-like N-terminal domain-containing protein n=1 Tax=Lasiosphaeris hirsuta TaxID=260670 RepID=A0AA40DJ70_9PEZI|nr:hypothetical protein B0H67DRAFT_558341 [Lasiosphaeris hirsuta]
MPQELGRTIHSIDALYDFVYTPELNLRMDQIEDPFSNSFHWVFDVPIFTQGLQVGPQLFWIHGKLGLGKLTWMKFIYKSRHTWDLLHNWRTNVLEIKASFFFHYRVTAIQKSFEGVLRSLIAQILRTHMDALSKTHRLYWDEYQEITGGGEKARNRYKAFKRSASLKPPFESFERHGNSQTLSLLAQIVTEFRSEDRPVLKLERILRLLLKQDALKMHLVVFFDALDEFDGPLDVISRFLKGLTQASETSATRVKVCFSSRPWEPLRAHFSSYPNFALEGYTITEIENYTASSVADWEVENLVIINPAPKVISRANAIFLWVTLAIRVLHEPYLSSPEKVAPALMEQKLQELPDDPFDFYKVTI